MVTRDALDQKEMQSIALLLVNCSFDVKIDHAWSAEWFISEVHNLHVHSIDCKVHIYCTYMYISSFNTKAA